MKLALRYLLVLVGILGFGLAIEHDIIWGWFLIGFWIAHVTK